MVSSLKDLKFSNLDASKAVGIDGIGPRMLKNCALPLCYPICLLFTKCFEQCAIIPSEWGVHIVIPVHKSGDKNLVNNYRLISLLCNTSKVLEKLVYDKVINFVSQSISSVQFGALKGKSAFQQLVVFLEFIYSNSSDQIDSALVL